MKKIISAFITLSVLLCSIAVPCTSAFADMAEKVSFRCGLNAVAELDRASGVMTVSGKGDMNFFYDDIPWWSYRNEIKEVIIEEGITKICSSAFLDCEIVRVTFPESLEFVETNAFAMNELENFVIPENSKLSEVLLSDYFYSLPWYENQPDGPVYLGKLLLDYKGTVPADTTIAVKDGTYAVNSDAFYGDTNVVNVSVPDSVERIGEYAFFGTAWQNSQPYYEPIYLGNVLYYYNFPWRVIEDSEISDELVIPEGVVSISPGAFDSHCTFRNVVLPESLEHIGAFAFNSCGHLEKVTVPENGSLETVGDAAFYSCDSLVSFDFNEGLKRIGINAFLSSGISEVCLPSTVCDIGLMIFAPASLDSFTVSQANPYYCVDENGILYNKDKTEVVASYRYIEASSLTLPATVTKIGPQAFAAVSVSEFILPKGLKIIDFEAFTETPIKEMIIPYGVERIGKYAFAECDLLESVEVSKTVEFIDGNAFRGCGSLDKAVIPREVNYIAESAFSGCDGVTVYCYEGSTAYYYALENEYLYILLTDPDTTELDILLKDYEKLHREKYTPESLALLDNAVAAVDETITVISQDTVNLWTENIKSAFEGLVYEPADYSDVEAAIERANGLNRSLYTAESLAVLDEAIACIDETLDVSDQRLADEYANAINNAIDSLEYLPADYTKVSEAISEAQKLDRLLYSNATLSILDQSIDAVDYTLNITQQNIADGFADRINTAVASLAYAEVVLRNERNGVIVSATAKEIYPTTELTVDILDASEFEGANFAIGGHIRNVQYYDINLIRGGEKVQPDGKVTVKVRIPDGVSPENCRVYHVTDDPVDPLVRFASTLAGNYIVFETDHFSEFAVIEVETYLSGISVTDLPAKLTYNINEEIDLTGIEVSALFSDGTSQTITEYDVSDVDMSSVGTKIVTVYYTVNGITKSASFNVTVTEDINAEIRIDGEAVNEYNRKVRWYMGYSSESVQLECDLHDAENYSIEWSSDNGKVLVDENGKVTNKGFLFSRSATITMTVKDSAGNVLATDKITVRFYKFSFQLTRMQTAAIIKSRKEKETELDDAQ